MPGRHFEATPRLHAEPAGQAPQKAAPAAAKKPGLQSRQVPPPRGAYWSAEHCTGWALGEEHPEPAGQIRQDDWPVVLIYLPASQSVQAICPTLATVPTAQMVRKPFVHEYPAVQGAHDTALSAE